MGSKAFIEETKQQLGFRAKGRKMNEREETFELREAGEDYDFMARIHASTLSQIRVSRFEFRDGFMVY